MVIRTFFDSNNTLVYNQPINTGKNPVAELFYGGSIGTNYSRFIFKFNEERIKEFRDKGMYPDLSKLTHTLRMTNTGTFDASLLGGHTADGKARGSSFKLQLFTVDQPWDEGVGYDFGGQKYFNNEDASVISYNPSNWSESNTGTVWANGGGTFSDWSGATLVGGEINFADGSENINIDITDIVNQYLSGGTTNNGLGLAFIESLEGTNTDETQYTGFFTRHTQTFYEPYVESKYSETIVDNRGNFYMDKLNKLYLYTNLGGIPTNVDDKSTMSVTIHDNDGEVFSTITSSGITEVTQGVYSIELSVPSADNYDCTLYTDTWSGITMDGVSRPEVILDFEIKNSENYYNIGAVKPKSYVFNVSGVRSNENINRGDIRKISVMARVPYKTNQQEVLDSLEYRLYVKEGAAEFTVIDYTPVELAFNYNYFLLDTASLVPQKYYLDIKSTSNYEVTTSKNIISFDIVSQVDERKG